MPIHTYEHCQRCFRLPPPPMFSLEPPPQLLVLEPQCPSRLMTRSSKTFSTSLPSLFVVLGFLLTTLLIILTLFFIKNRRQQQQRQIPLNHRPSTLPSSNIHSTKFVPLLSDSSSSDRMSNESPCVSHEYEQIRDDYGYPSSDCCLVYCRECANYHPIVSSPCVRLYYLPVLSKDRS